MPFLFLAFAVTSHLPDFFTIAQNVTQTREALMKVFGDAGLGSYAILASFFYNTTFGQMYLEQLSTGDHLLFTPTAASGKLYLFHEETRSSRASIS